MALTSDTAGDFLKGTEKTGPGMASPRNANNILQQVASKVNPSQISYEMTGGSAPGDIGMGFGMAATGQPFSKGLNVGAQAEGARTNETNKIKDPFSRFIGDLGTNPQTWVGPAMGVAKAGKAIGGAASAIGDIRNPLQAASQVSQGIEDAMGSAKASYREGLDGMAGKYGPQMAEGMGDAYAPKTVSFAEELNSPKTLAEQKIFNAVKNEAAYQGMDVNKLSPEESKNILDIFKDKVGQHVVAGEVGPTEINQPATIESMKAKQLDAFPEFSGMDKAYGPKANAYKAVEGKAPALLEGGGNRITKAAQIKSLGELDPALESRVKNYRNANGLWKVIKNPFVEAVAGGSATAAYVANKFLGGKH